MTTTHDTSCTGGGQRGEQLVAYLYDDLDSSERTAIESHLSLCGVCREELAALGAVRAELGRWTPPEPARGLASSPAPPETRAGLWATLSDIPVWAQAAAAVLCVGVAAGLANLEVRYSDDGLVVRTGWSGSSAPGNDGTSAGGAVTVSAPERPWQSDLAELERELRAELGTGLTEAAVSRPAAAESSADVTRVRGLIDESEQRQRRELALRLAEILRDVQGQRRDDLEKIDRSLGVIQSNLGVVQSTGVEVMRQRQMINDLAVRVSQR